MTYRGADAIFPINLLNLPFKPDFFMGYVDGNWPDWSVIHAQHLGVPVYGLEVFGSSPSGDGTDSEPGDATVAQAAAATKQRLAAGAWRPIVYTMASWGAAMVAAHAALGIARSSYRLILAHYGAGQHICGPTTCNTPGSAQADATQWIDHGGWDETLADDNFLPTTHPIPVTAQGPGMFIYCTHPNGTRKDAIWINPDTTVEHGWSLTGDLSKMTPELLKGKAKMVCSLGWDGAGNFTVVVHGMDDHPWMMVSNGAKWIIPWTQLPYKLPPPAQGQPGPAYNDAPIKAAIVQLQAKTAGAAKALAS